MRKSGNWLNWDVAAPEDSLDGGAASEDEVVVDVNLTDK